MLAGLDFFPRRSWGISLDVLYDHVWNNNSNSPARYQGVTLGILIPFSQLE